MTTGPTEDYYEMLGVSPDAEHEEIKKAYRRALRDNHPDKVGPSGAVMFRMVQTAWENLGTEDARANYDAARKAPAAPSAPSQPSSPPQRPATTPPSNSAQKAPQAPQAPKRQMPSPASQNPYAGAQSMPTRAKPMPTRATGKSQNNQPVSVEDDAADMVRFRNAQSQRTDLSSVSFSPSRYAFLPHLGVSVGVMLIGAFLCSLMWLGGTPVSVMWVALLMSLVGIAVTAAKERHKRAQLVGVILVIVSWALSATAYIGHGTPGDHVGFAIAQVLFFVGGAGALAFLAKYGEVRELNRVVPVPLLREARVFGTNVGSSPAEAVVLRNLGAAISPITEERDGTFVLFLDGLKLDSTRYPVPVVVVRGDKVAVVTFMAGAPGRYEVAGDGNVVKMFDGGLSHQENNNPQALLAAEKLKKSLKDVTVKTFVVVIPTSAGVITGASGEATVVTSRQNAVSDFAEFLSEEDFSVRRDVLSLFVPSLGVQKV